MTITVQGRVPRDWGDETVSHLSRRLQTLEKALSGGQDRFLTPETPSFGSGTVTGGASAPSGGVTEVTTVVETADTSWRRRFMTMGA